MRILLSAIARAPRPHFGLRKALFLPFDYGWESNPKIEPGKATSLDRFMGVFSADFLSSILLARTFVLINSPRHLRMTQNQNEKSEGIYKCRNLSICQVVRLSGDFCCLTS